MARDQGPAGRSYAIPLAMELKGCCPDRLAGEAVIGEDVGVRVRRAGDEPGAEVAKWHVRGSADLLTHITETLYVKLQS